MKAVTLIRPWGYAIAHLGKDIENRTWNCYLQPGEELAIHSGKKWDDAALPFIQTIHPGLELPPEALFQGVIIAIARFDGNCTRSNSPWFMGPIGWKLSNVQAIEPVECRGAQGLWTVPTDVAEVVQSQRLVTHG